MAADQIQERSSEHIPLAYKAVEGGGFALMVSGMESAGPGGSSALPAGTDRSGSITAGNAAQVLAAANAARLSLVLQNISASDLWVSEITTAVIDGVGSFKLPAGQAFSVGTNRAISVIGATTGQKFTATET